MEKTLGKDWELLCGKSTPAIILAIPLVVHRGTSYHKTMKVPAAWATGGHSPPDKNPAACRSYNATLLNHSSEGGRHKPARDRTRMASWAWNSKRMPYCKGPNHPVLPSPLERHSALTNAGRTASGSHTRSVTAWAPASTVTPTGRQLSSTRAASKSTSGRGAGDEGCISFFFICFSILL